MTKMLKLRLLGGFALARNEIRVTEIRTHKTLALLSYLATTAQPHSRSALAGLLWGGMPEAEARGNVSKALSILRPVVGHLLITTRQTVAFEPDDGCWCDVAAFEAATNRATIEDLQAAVQLYQGDFLADFSVHNAPEFEHWVLGQQVRLKGLALQALHTLSAHFAQKGDHGRPQALAHTGHLLQLEPWREEAHRQLMELLAQDGQRAAALHQYEVCRQALWDELAVEPSAATRALYERLKVQPLPKAGPTKPQFVTTADYTLVGREREWHTLQAQWQNLSQPHFICISGEAGIGKTRLAEELIMRVEGAGQRVARTRSHALQGRLAYGPVADWLRADPLKSSLNTLDDVWLTEIVRLLPELLIDRPKLPQPEPLTESWQRKRLFEALAQAFTHNQTPLLLVLDDLQWSDNDTLEWLHYLFESAGTPLLVIGTVRAEEIDSDHPLPHIRQQLQRLDRITDISLSYLTPAATHSLAGQVSDHDLRSDLTDKVFADSGGNPLFVIESVRAAANGPGLDEATVVAAMGGTSRIEAIPARMYSVIRSRLARLSPEAARVAEMGATIGRAFDIPLLSRALDISSEQALLALDELWQQRIIREVDSLSFDFSHDRLRDVAYAEITPIKRRLLHQYVVHALEEIHGKNLDDTYGQLAGHCEAAGLFERAFDLYRQAADRARQLFAHQEAINNRRRALFVLRQELPQTAENAQKEIELLLALSQDQTNAFGKGIPVVAENLAQAQELAYDVGTALHQLKVLDALATYHRVRGEWITALDISTKFFATAQEFGDPAMLARSQFSIATALMRRGDLEEACLQFEQNLQYLPTTKSALPDFACLTNSAYCLWLLGFPEQALRRFATALPLAREQDQTALPMVLHHYASILVFCRDISLVDTLSAELVEVTIKRKDDFSLHWGKIYRGWLQIHQEGNSYDGIAIIREHADALRALGNYFYECVWRSFLAEAYLQVSRLDAAIAEIDTTLDFARKHGDRHWDAYLLKLRGDYLQACAATDADIEDHYQRAIATAHQQQARSLELRATTSLCRLWQRQGKTAAAYQWLANIYGWFSEGFDTADLMEARALLAELEEA